ncbi:MAG: hypothetical protein PUD41_05670 [bacterium]|nr:hypothetical protein [bacterium]
MLVSCGRSTRQSLSPELQHLDSLVAAQPDSALRYLPQVPVPDVADRYAYATWCLLKTWTEYRCYQPITTDTLVNKGFGYFVMNSDDHGRRALAYYLRAVVHEEMKVGDNADHVLDLMKGCKEADQCDDHVLASQLYHRYGLAMTDSDRHDEAKVWLERFLDRATKANSKKEQIIALINLSNNALYLAGTGGDTSVAIEYAAKAYHLALEWNMPVEQGKAAGQLSACYSRSQNAPEALKYAIVAKDIDEMQRNLHNLKTEVVYTRIADAHRKLGNADSALYYARKNECSNRLRTRKNATQIMYMVYRDLLGDNDRAVELMSLYNLQSDSMKREMQAVEVAKNEAVYGQEQEQNARSEARNQRTVMLVVLAVIVVAAVLTVRVLRRQLRKTEAKAESRMTHLHQAEARLNEVQQEMQSEIAMLQSRLASDKERSGKLSEEIVNNNTLVAQLRRQPRFLTAEEWKKLESIVDSGYDGYMRRLDERFATLTEVDRQLCMLIRLRFEVKDMARIMAVSATSVSRQKLRLKNRLLAAEPDCLSSGIGLDAFLMSF